MNMNMTGTPSKTYSFFSLRNDSEIRLYSWAANVGLSSLVTPDKLHLSLISSDDYCNYRPQKNISVKLESYRFRLSILNDCLVLIAPNDELEYMHRNIIKKYKISSRYPEFIPHITLCTNFKPSEHMELYKYGTPNFDIYLDGEHAEMSGVPIFEAQKFILKA